MKFQMKSTAKAVALGIVTLAASAAFATQTPVEFDLKGHDEFVKSLGKDAIAPQQRTAEESKAILAKVYNEKLEQHVSSFHYEKGVTCISCHDQQKQGGPDWMVPVTNPPMKKECGDCHETQAYVVSHTKSHSKYECTVCHMPNTAAGPNDGSNGKMDAVRRLHTYKINVSPDASTWTKDKDGAWVLSKDEDGHGYVDLMWSCARNAPADYTVAEGRGCHSKATSELDPGLVYQDEKEVYGEVMKWQKPVKDGYEQIKGGVERVSKLLEVTTLPYDKQTQIRLLLDKATEVSDLIEKDGKTMDRMREDIRRDLSYMPYAPILFISALTGQRVGRLFELINYVNDQAAMRITTGTLNSVLADAQTRVQPPTDKGRRLKIYYMTQVGVCPPHFVIFCNDRQLFHFSYQRYIENCIRNVFGLEGTPIILSIRQKGDKEE